MYNTATKARIQAALLTLMSKKEIHEISIKEICSHAEISRTSYYRYYYTQQDVLHDIFQSLLHEIVDTVEYDYGDERYLHRSLLFGICQLRRNKDTLKIILSSSCEAEFMHEWNARWQDQCRNSILNRNEHEEYRLWYADFVFFGIYSIYRKWILEDCRISEEQICKVLENALYSLLLNTPTDDPE